MNTRLILNKLQKLKINQSLTNPILYLGPWCFENITEIKYQISLNRLLPYHWLDNEKLEKDQKYLEIIYSDILVKISRKLNQIHNVNLSFRYWDILIGDWLLHFVHCIFDRWETIQSIKENIDSVEVYLPKYEEKDFIPSNILDFDFQSENWNLYIFSQIIKYENYFNWKEDPNFKLNGFIRSENIIKKNWKSKFINYFQICLAKIIRNNKGIFFIHLMTRRLRSIFLSFINFQIPFNWLRFHRMLIVFPKADLSVRNWNLHSSKEHDRFLSFLYLQIPKNIPVSYHEGYINLNTAVKNIPLPNNPSTICTSALDFDDLLNAWIAEKVTSGTRYFRMQHGGFYGYAKYSFYEIREKEISDFFLTWGWNDNSKKTLSFQMQKEINIPKRYKKLKPKIFFFLYTMPKFSISVNSECFASRYLDWFEYVCQIINKLTLEVKANLVVRTAPKNNWNEGRELKVMFPEINIDYRKYPLKEVYSSANLIVACYPSTTLLELIGSPIPVCETFSEYHFPPRENVVEDYKKLESVNIYHRTADPTSNFINSNYPDFDSWWNEDNVAKVKNEHRFRYARNDSRFCKDLTGLIKGK